jgi:hypothetical protein
MVTCLSLLYSLLDSPEWLEESEVVCCLLARCMKPRKQKL